MNSYLLDTQHQVLGCCFVQRYLVVDEVGLSVSVLVEGEEEFHQEFYHILVACIASSMVLSDQEEDSESPN